MSGHSKWATIKRTKAKVDAAKGATYARMSREIIVAARMGGGDPTANFRLRTAIEKAKASGVPNENIARAVKKGSGDDAAEQYEEITYEGYGPGGVAIVIEAMTDNRNRTAADIRAAFNKSGGNMGETGCVGWMFRREGHVVISNEAGRYGEEDLLLEAADAGAEDIRVEDDTLRVVCPPASLEAVQTALAKAGFPVAEAEESLVPQNMVDVGDRDVAKRLIKLMNALDDLDDVQNVTANFDIADNLLAELANF